MHAFRAVYRHELGSALRMGPLLALYAAIAVLAVSLTVVMTGHLALEPVANLPDPSPAGYIVGITGCLAALIVGGVAFPIMVGSPLTRDQSTGRLIAVVASPAGARPTWAGRALALSTFACGFAVITGPLVSLIMLAVWVPHIGLEAVPAQLWVLMLLVVPVYVVALGLFTMGVGMALGVGAVASIGNIAYIAVTTTMGRLAGAGLSASGYLVAGAVIAGVVVIAAAGVSLFLTRERVVQACG